MDFINLKIQQERLAEKLNSKINKVLRSTKFIMGPEVFDLEEQLAEFVGTKHCITCSSGTDALLMALMANNIGPGDEVITSSFSFFATAEVISLLGATPIFVDINADDYIIDTELIKKSITPKTKAIIPVSLYGLFRYSKELKIISEEYNIPIIEDAAQSFGATENSVRSGSQFQLACTSFFPTKPLGCYGDGGAIFTNDDELKLKLQQIRVHGQSQRYHHTTLGINGRLDTIQAAVLQVKMEYFEEELELRQEKANYYRERLSNFKIQKVPEHCISAYAQFSIEVDDRTKITSNLNKAGVPYSIHYPTPIHQQPLYKEKYKNIELPITERASQRILSIPFHPYITRAEQDKVIKALEGVHKK